MLDAFFLVRRDCARYCSARDIRDESEIRGDVIEFGYCGIVPAKRNKRISESYVVCSSMLRAYALVTFNIRLE